MHADTEPSFYAITTDRVGDHELKIIFESNLDTFNGQPLSGDQNLEYYPISEIGINIFTMLENITSVDLSDNSFYRHHQLLTTVLSALPPHVTSVSLRANLLGDLDDFPLSTALMAIPETVISIDLSSNNLQLKKENGLEAIISALKPNVTSINFSDNGLNMFKSEELSRLTTQMPPHLTVMNLSNNSLWMNYKQLILLLTALQYVTSISLSNNNLGTVTIDILELIMQAIQPSVQCIDLRENGLDAFTEAEYQRITNALPEGIKIIYTPNHFFSPTNLLRKKDRERLQLQLNDKHLNNTSISGPDGNSYFFNRKPDAPLRSTEANQRTLDMGSSL